MLTIRRHVSRIAITLAALLTLVIFCAAAFVANIIYGAHAGVATLDGTVRGLPLHAPARIIRDDRGIPHIRARDNHDLYFAQGYATASDRLFQIDITRRYVLGRLGEILGANLLTVDERQRTLDVRAIVNRQYAALPRAQRDVLDAFADGINFAATHEPVPPEFRALVYTFEPWQPQDSLVVGFATTIDLADGPNNVITRDRVVQALGPHSIDAFFSLTDPFYDSPTVGGPHAHIAPLPSLSGPSPLARYRAPRTTDRQDVLGSNEWVAGATRTATGRAMLANDPHLDSSIPGIWHLAELEAPGIHVAGATLAGIPGIVLGHNEHLAWGSTNGTVVAPRVFAETFNASGRAEYLAGSTTLAATLRIEHFAVRFGPAVERRYTATRHGFVLEENGIVRHAVQWYNADSPVSALSAFYGLDRAASIGAARSVLATYPGPVQNFVLADDSGRASYTVAGFIPTNADWGLHVRSGADAPPSPLDGVPFDRLPHRDASADLVANNSNNLPYDSSYPLRLSAFYSAPYRAAEIAHDLRSRRRYTIDDFRAIGADTMSFAERDLAKMCAAALRANGDDTKPRYRAAYRALATFDGHMEATSRAATFAQALRQLAATDLIRSLMPPDIAANYLANGPVFVTLMRALREHPKGWFAHDDADAFLRTEFKAVFGPAEFANAMTPYGDAHAVITKHPLAAFGIPWWNGPRLPGSGGSYAPAVQTPEFGQSFRAVWDVGNWDAGGIDIPLGESGEPGSPHYTDLSERYVRHMLTALPFSDAAVAKSARHTLLLER